MPELPEVETVRRVLEEWLIGRKIVGFRLLYPPIFKNASEKEVQNVLIGQTFVEIDRQGKFLILKTKKFAIISHLRMEGKYYLGHYKGQQKWKQGAMYDEENIDDFSKHVHVIFELDNGAILMYHDVRKFGTMALYTADTYMDDAALAKLGDEPFQMDGVDELFAKLQNRTTSIKSVLLNQSLVAGLGNIYVDEVLFLSNVDPREACFEIQYEQLVTIIKRAQEVLQRAIEMGGTTIRSYHANHFVDGKFQDELYVYGREGEPCRICQTPIVKMTVAQRGTHFCPQCQRKRVEKPVRVLGITGVIGSGKSTVSTMFEKMGCTILDADQYARKALEPGTESYQKVVKRFGNGIVDSHGQINRSLLRKKVANHPKRLKFLESVIHPFVIQQTKNEINKKQGLYLMDVPLLFEAKMNELCDVTIFVHTQDKVRKQRLIERGTMSLQTAEDLRKNTWTDNQKMMAADFIIDNSSTLEQTQMQVEQLKNYLWNPSKIVL